MGWGKCILILMGVPVLGVLLGALAGRWRWVVDNEARLQWEATLATGAAAVTVAWLTVRRLQQQIGQTAELEEDRRQRRERAARAVLPLALTEIGEYSTACIRGLYSLRPEFYLHDGTPTRRHSGGHLKDWPIPRLPESVLPVLKECIEFCDDKPAEAMAELVRHYQVQSLRLEQDISWFRAADGVHMITWPDIQRRMLDAAELYARGGALIPFSRGETSEVRDFGRFEINNALTFAFCILNDQEIEELANIWQFEHDHPMPRPNPPS